MDRLHLETKEVAREIGSWAQPSSPCFTSASSSQMMRMQKGRCRSYRHSSRRARHGDGTRTSYTGATSVEVFTSNIGRGYMSISSRKSFCGCARHCTCEHATLYSYGRADTSIHGGGSVYNPVFYRWSPWRRWACFGFLQSRCTLVASRSFVDGSCKWRVRGCVAIPL